MNDARHLAQRPHERLPELTPEYGFVAHARPIRHVEHTRWAGVGAQVALQHLVRAAKAPVSQPRHRRVERDAVQPRRQHRVSPEQLDLADGFEQDILGDFLRIFPVLHVPER